MYGLMAINGIVFGVQGSVQRRMTDPDLLSSHFIAGAVAGKQDILPLACATPSA